MSTQATTIEEPSATVRAATTPVVRKSAPAAGRLFGHIPALDVVRGLAILMVTSHRFFPAYDDPSFAGRALTHCCDLGVRGVDLFFVLSGFLITGILWDAKGREQYFRNFYMRRALRIFPLYYGALLITLILLPALGLATSPEFSVGVEYSPWLWLYGSNILIAWKGAWCLGAYNHFWSLAVEEHFYLVWPLVIFFCMRKTAMNVCIAAIVLSAASRGVWLMSGGNEIAATTFTLFRVDALALGGLLALISRGPNGLRRLRPWAVYCCIALLIAMLPPVVLHKRMPMIRETMYAFLFASLIVLAVTAPTIGWLSRLWNLPSLRFFGKYSYGMYVAQNFLKAIFSPELLIASMAAAIGSIFLGRCVYLLLMSVATVLAALITWNLLEKHFIKLKSHFEYIRAKRQKSARQLGVAG